MAYEQRGERDFGGQGGGGGGFEGGFGRGRGRRAVTDYGSTMVHWMRNRQPRYKGGYQGELERPSPSYIVDMLPPLARLQNPADSIPARHLHSSLNKIKHPVNVVRWTPEGRRLLTASSSGEFTLWNGTGFNFETIMQAHDVAIRALSYSHSDDWLLSADHDGLIKYWQPNFNNVKVIQGHNDPIRDLAFSPNDAKFVTASDDSSLKIFDFAEGVEEATLSGHGWDAKSVDWHPTKGLLVSGSKDHLVKLWDPRTGRCLTTLHGHKNTITKTLFERVRGECLATSARDQTARVFDLRMMRDICLLKGHEKEISTLAWHPIHSSLLSTGGGDGSMLHYLLDEPNTPQGTAPSLSPYDSPDPTTAPAQTVYPAHKVQYAHDFPIWSLDWHPLGHILASGSNDRVTRFWTRARPGDTEIFNDRYHIGESAAEAQGTWDRRGNRKQRQEEEEQEMEDEMEGLVDQKMPAKMPSFPGIPGLPLPQFGKDGGVPKVQIPGMGGAVPPPPLPFGIGAPPPLPGMDPSNPPDLAKLAEMMKKAGLPPPPPGGKFPPPPPPGMLPPGLLPPPGNFQLPPGFPPPPPGMGGPPPFGIPGMGAQGGSEFGGSGDAGGNVRRRGPLPSQEESLQMEQRKGKYTRAR
ncbi:Polyadenylation factor subunit [Lachnellula hyalina]|uniref:Polyadenylation factor subunit 2 n=1 Tax=Lachnellula hyalina TaxID=1316788 RepID=A0A8H8U466_9HELO|nr:Polyadenylation factor subunit [Lachnellula hyalina]TVY30790.1 Polyadenylation factor subunit [Lachnellula hyalina]